MEFGLGLRGESGDSGADVGQDDGLAKKRDGGGSGAAGNDERVAVFRDVGADGGDRSGSPRRGWTRGWSGHRTRHGARGKFWRRRGDGAR